MFEIFLDLLAIESSYKIYIEAIDSKNWMMIPFFGLAFSLLIPSGLSLSNKITDQSSRRIVKYIAIAFFSWTAIMIIVLIDTQKYNEIVGKNITDHVDSLNCDELLNFISYYKSEKPRYMYLYDDRQAEIEQKYFERCGVK